jgi:hypothetical protein
MAAQFELLAPIRAGLEERGEIASTEARACRARTSDDVSAYTAATITSHLDKFRLHYK